MFFKSPTSFTLLLSTLVKHFFQMLFTFVDVPIRIAGQLLQNYLRSNHRKIKSPVLASDNTAQNQDRNMHISDFVYGTLWTHRKYGHENEL